jgi:hypothetical protein
MDTATFSAHLSTPMAPPLTIIVSMGRVFMYALTLDRLGYVLEPTIATFILSLLNFAISRGLGHFFILVLLFSINPDEI